jgi:hypothetical protein
MPIRDPVARAAYHKKYMKEVWYPKNSDRHKAMVAVTRSPRVLKHKEAVMALKISCGICGESRPWVLDFHHRDPKEKKTGITGAIVLGWSLERIMEEVRKCDVICANCHRDLHWKERTGSFTLRGSKVANSPHKANC